MPPKKVTLPDHIKNAVLDEIELDYRAAQEATLKYKIRIHLAREQGVWQQDIADRLGKPTSTISDWSKEGADARNRRGRVSSERSGEREPIS